MACDTRVRWALEEVGQRYEAHLVSFTELKEPAYLARHPFGQIPTYAESNLDLFETGAIVFHIADRYPASFQPIAMPVRGQSRGCSRPSTPSILELTTAKIFEADKPWSNERRHLIADRIRAISNRLSARLRAAGWLDHDLSAGDLLMVSVLLRLRLSGILDEYAYLAASVARGEARSDYRRAFAAQLAINASGKAR